MTPARSYHWLGLLPVAATFAVVQCHTGDTPTAPTARPAHTGIAAGAGFHPLRLVPGKAAADLIDAGFLP